MIQKGFLMSINKDQHYEYKKRHDELWPEMVQTLKEHGAHNYSIFLDENSSQLFAYVEIENEEKWSNISKTVICKKWWAYMKDIMPSNPDNSPISTDLKQVFYLK